jgi:hypothetical protein
MLGLTTVYYDNGQFANVNALYNAALLAPNSVKLGPQDPWGNIKVPSLESLDHSLADGKGWIQVPNSKSTVEEYTSLVGLPTVGRPMTANAKFNLESTYLSVQCSKFVRQPFPSSEQHLFNFNKMDLGKLSKIISGQVWTNESMDNSSQPFTGTTFFLDTDLPLFDGSVSETPEEYAIAARFNAYIGFMNQSALEHPLAKVQRKLIFGSAYTLGDETTQGFGINVANCSLSQTHVESVVECINEVCAVKQVRKSATDQRPSTFTGLEHNLITSQFVKSLPTSISGQTQAGSSATERFLSSPKEFPFIQSTGGYTGRKKLYVDLASVPLDVFSRRLSLLLNTYYQLSVGPTGYFGSLPQNYSLYGPDTLPVEDLNAYLPKNNSATEHPYNDWFANFDIAMSNNGEGAPFIGATTNATITSHEEMFVCDFAWMSLLLAASTVILVTGMAALLLRRKTMAPEMFGFVASMTYENAHVKIPKGGNVLDAMERARILKNMRVCIGDVNGDSEVGHIAFCAGTKFRPLERGRLYE